MATGSPALIGVAALIASATAAPAAQGSGLLVPLCGGGFITLPAGDPAHQRHRDDCGMACHAACRPRDTPDDHEADADEG